MLTLPGFVPFAVREWEWVSGFGSRLSPEILSVLLMICRFLNNWWNDSPSMCQHCCHALLSSRWEAWTLRDNGVHHHYYIVIADNGRWHPPECALLCVMLYFVCVLNNKMLTLQSIRLHTHTHPGSTPTPTAAYEWWAVKQSAFAPSRIQDLYWFTHKNRQKNQSSQANASPIMVNFKN